MHSGKCKELVGFASFAEVWCGLCHAGVVELKKVLAVIPGGTDSSLLFVNHTSAVRSEIEHGLWSLFHVTEEQLFVPLVEGVQIDHCCSEGL